jgi:hypothetical protein
LGNRNVVRGDCDILPDYYGKGIPAKEEKMTRSGREAGEGKRVSIYGKF